MLYRHIFPTKKRLFQKNHWNPIQLFRYLGRPRINVELKVETIIGYLLNNKVSFQVCIFFVEANKDLFEFPSGLSTLNISSFL